MWDKANLDLGIYYPPFSAFLKFSPEVNNKGERYGPTTLSLQAQGTTTKYKTECKESWIARGLATLIMLIEARRLTQDRHRSVAATLTERNHGWSKTSSASQSIKGKRNGLCVSNTLEIYQL